MSATAATLTERLMMRELRADLNLIKGLQDTFLLPSGKAWTDMNPTELDFFRRCDQRVDILHEILGDF